MIVKIDGTYSCHWVLTVWYSIVRKKQSIYDEDFVDTYSSTFPCLHSFYVHDWGDKSDTCSILIKESGAYSVSHAQQNTPALHKTLFSIRSQTWWSFIVRGPRSIQKYNTAFMLNPYV
jgi:hypothetical protein